MRASLNTPAWQWVKPCKCTCRPDCRRRYVTSGAENAWAFLPAVGHQRSHTFHESLQTSSQEGGKLALLQMRLVKRWWLYPKTWFKYLRVSTPWEADERPIFLQEFDPCLHLNFWFLHPLPMRKAGAPTSLFMLALQVPSCLAVPCKNNACLRQAGWIEQASSTTPWKLIRGRVDAVGRKWIFGLRNR